MGKIGLFIFLLTLPAFASKENFQQIKQQVDELENSVIQEFSFAIPKSYGGHFDSEKQIQLGAELEEKFSSQKHIFFIAEEGLYNIERSLPNKVKTGELSEVEAQRLLTSVEYARRIIIHTSNWRCS